MFKPILSASVKGAQKSPPKVEEKSDSPDPFLMVEKKSSGRATVAALGKAPKSKAGGMSLPPEIDLTVSFRHKFRFQAGAASVVTAVNYNEICNLLQVGTGAHTLQGIISTFKLRSVTIWPALSTSTTDGAALEWSAAGEFFKDQLKNRTYPEGQTVTGALRFTPPPKSLASFWSASSSNVLFYITAPSGSILDLDLDCTLCGAYAPPSAVTAVGSVTVGNFYYGYLDGVSTHIWAPVITASQF